MPGASPTPACEGDQRIVDDENASLVADARHDAADDRFVRRAIDARDAQADRRRNDARAFERALHHGVEDLLERELACSLEVRALLAPLREDSPHLHRRAGRPSWCRRHRCQEQALPIYYVHDRHVRRGSRSAGWRSRRRDARRRWRTAIIDIRRSAPPGVERAVDLMATSSCPGFIDVHVHGLEGVDTLDGPELSPTSPAASEIRRHRVLSDHGRVQSRRRFVMCCSVGGLRSRSRIVRRARAARASGKQFHQSRL